MVKLFFYRCYLNDGIDTKDECFMCTGEDEDTEKSIENMVRKEMSPDIQILGIVVKEINEINDCEIKVFKKIATE